MSTIDTDKYKKLLLAERDRLRHAVEYLHEENPGTINEETGEQTAFPTHLADTATVTYDRELDISLEDNAEQVLAEIDAALQRIEDGTYGICSNCGKPIPEDRLEARPWTTLCLDCARTAQ